MAELTGLPLLGAATAGGVVLGYGFARWRSRKEIARLKQTVEAWKDRAHRATQQAGASGALASESNTPQSAPPMPSVQPTPHVHEPSQTSLAETEQCATGTDAPQMAIMRGEPDPRFSAETVQALYARWCLEGRQPQIPSTVRAMPLRFAGSTRVNEWTPPVHSFQDHPQMGEFVRFADADDRHACALPHPESPFSEVVHRLLFSQLTPADFAEPARLAALAPVPLRKRDERTWEVAA